VSKNKPKETVEYVIRLQDKERKLLEDLVTAYNLEQYSNVFENVGLKKAMSDPLDMILWFTAAATFVELLGIDTPFITPIDAGKLFKDPDGATGFKGFWDVDLGRDWERFKEGIGLG
jgi:hypothetical protein